MEINLKDYYQRMERVIAHINTHLDEDLHLDDLADVACLSRFHWHRVYRGITGETIHSTVKRLKLNRASHALKHSNDSLVVIAQRAGYTRVESFARAFKAQLGHTPAAFRTSPDMVSRISTLKLESFAVSIQTENLPYDIKDLPSIRPAALHNRGSYNGSSAFNRLIKHAIKRNIPMAGHQMVGLYYDDPAVTPADDLRSIAGIRVGDDFVAKAPLEIFDTYDGRYAVFHYKGPYERTGLAYDWIFGKWMPQSGEQAAEEPFLHISLNTPDSTASEDLLTDICIPLRG